MNANVMEIFLPATISFLIGVAMTPFVSHFLAYKKCVTKGVIAIPMRKLMVAGRNISIMLVFIQSRGWRLIGFGGMAPQVARAFL